MRIPSALAMSLLLLPLDLWLVWKLHDALGTGKLALLGLAIALVTTLASPPGWLTRTFLPNRVARLRARAVAWSAIGAAIAIGLALQGIPLAAALLASRGARVAAAHARLATATRWATPRPRDRGSTFPR